MISRICAKQIDTNSLNQPLLSSSCNLCKDESFSFFLLFFPFFLTFIPRETFDTPFPKSKNTPWLSTSRRSGFGNRRLDASNVVFPGEKVEKRNRRRERDCSPPEKNSQRKERKEEDRCDVWRVVSGRQLRVAGGSKNLWRKLSAPVTAHCCQGNQTKRRDN